MYRDTPDLSPIRWVAIRKFFAKVSFAEPVLRMLCVHSGSRLLANLAPPTTIALRLNLAV
ncbi:hypothetical protein HCU64_19255 [Methylobacterium sp. C25]|uniref:hypothetical protein n=1 Tax=Methylobacterium sp. C25 TaxID=2721622 RepID=UPI001F284E0E|nr:hypothetical protein [Methylobacterium sp. C25]MCE4225895.1 hypothetical protein [Methylobacterium sp. C25]